MNSSTVHAASFSEITANFNSTTNCACLKKMLHTKTKELVIKLFKNINTLDKSQNSLRAVNVDININILSICITRNHELLNHLTDLIICYHNNNSEKFSKTLDTVHAIVSKNIDTFKLAGDYPRITTEDILLSLLVMIKPQNGELVPVSFMQYIKKSVAVHSKLYITPYISNSHSQSRDSVIATVSDNFRKFISCYSVLLRIVFVNKHDKRRLCNYIADNIYQSINSYIDKTILAEENIREIMINEVHTALLVSNFVENEANIIDRLTNNFNQVYEKQQRQKMRSRMARDLTFALCL